MAHGSTINEDAHARIEQRPERLNACVVRGHPGED